MSLNTVPIRAEIRLGNLVVKTPYILSFNVKKERNNKSTFQASLKVLSTDLNSLGNSSVVIKAGVEGNLNKIFTGDVLSSNPTPSWDDPKYVVLNVQGSDILHRLENEKFTRMQETQDSKWALITGINRKAPKGSQFKLVNHEVIMPTDGDHTTDAQKDYNTSVDVLGSLASPIPGDGGEVISVKTSNMKYIVT